MPRPRKHDTDRILDCARRVVLREGPRAASIGSIAQASGAPVGTLYHRFGSRDVLVAEMWLRALGRFQAGYLNAAEDPDPVQAGARMAAAVVSFARAHGADARLLLAVRRDDLMDSAPSPALAEQLEAMNRPLRAAIRRLARELHGSASARATGVVSLAVVDMPYGAVRRHAGEGAIPRWLEAEVARAARTLLAAAARPRTSP